MDNFDLRKYLAEGKLYKEEVDYSSIKGEMKKMYDIDVDLDTIKDFVTSYDDGEGMDIFDTTEREDFYLYLKDEGKLLKEELTWYIEDENEDIRFQNDEYLREVGKKIKEIHPDISDEDLNKIIIMAGEQYSREEDFHGDSIPSSNFVNAAVEIYQTDVLDSEDDKDFDRSSPENLDGDFSKDSMFAGWTRAQYDAYVEDPYAYLKDKTNPRLNEQMDNFDLRKYLAEGKLLKEEPKAPSGWTEIKDLSDMHRSEEDDEIAVKAWEAPMEGWDEENKDIIVVRKEDNKFYLDGYIPFGSFDEQGPFDTYEEALKLAVEEMEDLKKDWDEDLAEGKLLKEAINLDIEDDIVILSGDSGEYEGEIEDGKASFSVIYDDLDYRISDQYDESNIENFLGKGHAFIELAKKYDHKWGIERDLVGITIKLK